jgi:hypothetical protein
VTVQDCFGGDGSSAWDRLPDCGQLFEGKKPRPLAERIGKYAKAVARWVEAGRPVRDWPEVERIFDEVCKPCEKFDPKRGSCQGCGCKVNRDGRALKNKIRMATESCPEKRW